MNLQNQSINIWNGKTIIKIFISCLIIIGIFTLTTYLTNFNNGIKTMIFNLGSVISILIPVFYFANKNKISYKYLGFNEIKTKCYFISLLLGLIVLLFSSLLSLFFQNNTAELTKPELSDSLWINLINLKLFTALLGPFSEELLFKGVLFKFLRQKYNFIISALVSSLIFGILHFNFSSIIFTIFLGMVTAYAFEKSKSIIPPAIIHIIINTMAANMILFSIL